MAESIIKDFVKKQTTSVTIGVPKPRTAARYGTGVVNAREPVEVEPVAREEGSGDSNTIKESSCRFFFREFQG